MFAHRCRVFENTHTITDDNLKVAGDLADKARFRQQLDMLSWFGELEKQMILVALKCK